jgi:hypothetical protein
MFSRIAETMIAAPKLLKYCKYIQKQNRLRSCLNTVCTAKVECCADRPQTPQLDVACFTPRFAPRSYPVIYPKEERQSRPICNTFPPLPPSACQSFRARDHKKRIYQRSPITAPSRKAICLVQIASMEQELHVSPDPPIPTDSYLFL